MSSDHINPDKCIACTICQVYCPVAKATPKYLGPRVVGPAYERFRSLGVDEDPSLSYCSNCKGCDSACPHGVPITALNMKARCDEAERNGHKLREWILSHGGMLADMFKYIPAGLKNLGMHNPISRFILSKIGISRKALMPKFSKHFRLAYKSYKQKKYNKQVVYFPGCYIDDYDYSTGLDMIWILNQAGYEVIVPEEFCCCGLPLISNGFLKDAGKNAKINISVIKKYQDRGITIITGCPSCALMIKKDYPEFFPEYMYDTYKGGIMDAQAFLLNCVNSGELNLDLDKVNKKSVLYHEPCHLRAQGIGKPGVNLVEKVTDIRVDHAPLGCCGISGSYGFKEEKYDIGMKIGSELFKKVKESNSDIVMSECGTCRLQIEHGTGRKAIHPVTVIRKLVENK